MIKHVVMWKFKGENREKNIRRLKQMLTRIPERINLIEDFEIGVNF